LKHGRQRILFHSFLSTKPCLSPEAVSTKWLNWDVGGREREKPKGENRHAGETMD
jgi:hypothetical protein